MSRSLKSRYGKYVAKADKAKKQMDFHLISYLNHRNIFDVKDAKAVICGALLGKFSWDDFAKSKVDVDGLPKLIHKAELKKKDTSSSASQTSGLNENDRSNSNQMSNSSIDNPFTFNKSGSSSSDISHAN